MRAAGFILDALTMLHPVTEYAGAVAIFGDVIELPLLTRSWASILPLLRLRRRYDYAVIPFPATRWQYAAVARIMGARTIVTHDYGGLANFIVNTNQNSNIVPLRGGHRAAENNRLADALGAPASGDLSYLVPDSWRSGRIPGLVGIHTGSMMYKGNEARRWPFDRFVEIIRDQAVLKRRRVRVFIGPSEADDMRRLESAIGPGIEFVQAPLPVAARALSQCDVFVANDAGFAHLAAGLGVKTIALFGMTNPERAVPIGPVIALRPSSCPPCHDEGMRDFRCVLNINYRCMNEDFPPRVVLDAIEQALTSEMDVCEVRQNSTFRLYGREIENAFL
jgi:ADP-heptose:LPS heptosyltransferase